MTRLQKIESLESGQEAAGLSGSLYGGIGAGIPSIHVDEISEFALVTIEANDILLDQQASFI